MYKIRAIFIGDIRFDTSVVFEYDKTTNKFHMLSDKEFAYDPLFIFEDGDWITFKMTKSEYPEDLEDENEAFHWHVEKLSKKELKNILKNHMDNVI